MPRSWLQGESNYRQIYENLQRISVNPLFLIPMIRLLTIVGARPQFIKAAALSRVIRQEFSKDFNEIILHTGQHYDSSMSDVFFREMQIPEPAHNLDIGSASHGDQTGLMIQGIENLSKEGIIHSGPGPYSFDSQGVFHSGDLMYDNTLFFRELAIQNSSLLRELELDGKPYILATVHRPSNTDVRENLRNIVKALNLISSEMNIPVILPLHPRTEEILNRTGNPGRSLLKDPSTRLRPIPAVSFLDMISLEAGASLILTDSGGVQKEAWFMEKPVVILREETEWVEIVDAGNGRVAGADVNLIVNAARDYLEDPPQSFPSIFGNGLAAREILKVLTTTRWR